MEYLLRLINGIGNKIFILVYFLNKYPEDTLLIIDAKSHHQHGSEKEKIWHLYPKLLEHPKIKFIRWKEYDSLKLQGIKELEITNDIFHNIEGFSEKAIKKYFKINSEYDYLKTKYDFVKGLFVHFRLGDKFIQNYQKVRKGASKDYIVLKPEYYLKYISEFNGPIYIFSDDPKLAKCLLGTNYEYPIEDTNETLYCFQNAKHLIISESTMSIAGIKLQTKKFKAIVPGYFIWEKKVIKTPYFKKDMNIEIENDELLILNTKSDYEDVIKKCKVKIN
jgi:hypothetical protein